MTTGERNCTGRIGFFGRGRGEIKGSACCPWQPVCQRLEMSLVLAVVLSGQRPQMSQYLGPGSCSDFSLPRLPFTQQTPEHSFLEATHGQVPHWLWGRPWSPNPNTGLEGRMGASWTGPHSSPSHASTSRALLTPRHRGSPLLVPSPSVWASVLPFPVLCSIIKLILPSCCPKNFVFQVFAMKDPETTGGWWLSGTQAHWVKQAMTRSLPVPVWNMSNKKLNTWIIRVSPIRESWSFSRFHT